MIQLTRLKWLIKLRSGDAITNENLIDDYTKYPVYGGGKIFSYYNAFNIENTILIGRVGANCGTITKINDKAFATDNALVVQSSLNLNYLFYVLASAELNNLNTANAQPLITAGNVLNHNAYFENDIEKQKLIANFLDKKCEKIDKLISLEETAITELNEYKNQLTVKYTTKGVRKTLLKQSNIDWVGETPKHWQIIPLNAIFNEHSCKNFKMQENNLLSLSYGNIIRKNINTDFGLLPENFEGYNIVEKGDIVLRLTDLQNDQRSLRTGLVQERGIITSAYITLRNIVNANPDYLRYLLHSADICKIFYNLGSGIRQNLTFIGLRRMELVLPPKDEQDEIVLFLNNKYKVIDNLISLKQQKITELKEYKKSLIYEYVTGKKQPPKKDTK